MDNFTITRSTVCNYLFNIQDTFTGCYLAVNRTFQQCQEILGIIPEEYSRIDDGRFMLII